MKTFSRNMNSRLFALVAALALLAAQGGAQAQQPAPLFAQQQLDQMLAPIALYPDALLSQILLAATYPMEVIEAARWARDRPDLAGEAAVRAAATEDWDPSVKSLLAFPQVLARMAENLQWMQALGEAFLDRESEVMDTVQALRRKAQAAGNLSSDARLSVIESGPSLLLQAADPQLVYVPYYDPFVVYGTWWWPAHPPMYLRPWSGYYAKPAHPSRFYWGPPIGIPAGFFFTAIDWRRREVRVVQVNHIHHDHRTAAHPANVPPAVGANRPYAWRRDPDRRRGHAYRIIEAQPRFGAASAPPDHGNQARAADAHRSDHGMNARPAPWPEARPESHRPAAPPTGQTRASLQPTPVMQSAPVGQPAPAWRGDPHRARPESSASHEAPRAAQQRTEVRPARNAAHQETAAIPVARHESAARHAPPQGAARAEVRPVQAAARQPSGERIAARAKMVP